MKKIIALLLFILVFSFFLIRKTKTPKIIRGGYGTYLRELKCSILEINENDIIAVLEEDTNSPEELVKGDKLKLNFDIEEQGIKPKKLDLSKGEIFTLIYLGIDESKDMAEVNMHNPTKIKGKY